MAITPRGHHELEDLFPPVYPLGKNACVGSMHLYPALAFDVVKRIGQMARVALIDIRGLLTGKRAIHHLEVHHVVAGRWFMTLGASL